MDNEAHPTKKDKLARKLIKNQSIRSDQRRTTAASSSSKPPNQLARNHNVLKCGWFDGSRKSEDQLEKITKLILQVIDSSLSGSHLKTNWLFESFDRSISDSSEDEDDPSSPGHDITEDDWLIDDIPSKSDSNSNIRQSSVEPTFNHPSPFTCRGNIDNLDFLIGLNPILNYLEVLSSNLIELDLEFSKQRSKRFVNSADASAAQNLNPRTVSIDGAIYPEEDDHEESVADNSSLIINHRQNLEERFKNLRLIKLIIVFMDYQHHQSILNLLSVLVNQINQSLTNLGFLKPLNRSNSSISLPAGNETVNPDSNTIHLIGLPLVLNRPILLKFKLQRLSCFAILDSALNLVDLTNLILN